MTIREITAVVEAFAPLSLQENYDNAGLLVGDANKQVTGVLICLDITENVIEEALSLHCNLIIAHHPLIFKGLKRLTGKDEVQRCVISAIKFDIAIYAAHTNLDNVIRGVNGKLADKLNLVNCRILSPLQNSLCKLVTYVPKLLVQNVREALFNAGGGAIGNYDSCSFNLEGYGSFRAGVNANPFVGEINTIHYEPEVRIEVVLPTTNLNRAIEALLKVHPYEEPAYDILPIKNEWKQAGAGIVGELAEPVSLFDFLSQVKMILNIPVLRHTIAPKEKVSQIAICGGSGSFLIGQAIGARADVFITADIKYHEFMEADGKLVVVDAGHYETEQYTKELMYEIISKKFPTFALHISKVNTNPIQYL